MKYYDPELKAKVVKEVEETGNLKIVSRKYDIPPSTIEGWRKTLNLNGSHFISRKDEKKILLEENRRLKKLIGEHALEISILKDLVKKANHHKRIDSQFPEIG